MRARPRVLLTVLAAGGLLTTGALVGVSLDRDEPGRPAAPATTGGGAGPASGARAVAWQGGVLSPATSCDDLLGWYVDRAEELVTPWGWGGGLLDQGFLPRGGIVAEGFAARSQAPTGLSATAADSVGGGMTNATQSETGTNVQEAGVDEPDVAKSDGELLVRVEPGGWGGDLVVADVSGASVRETARLDLPDVMDPELLLVGSTVVVVGGDQEAEGDRPGARVLRVDVSDPAAPEVTDTLTVDSELLGVRQHGTTLRLVSRTGLPDLDFARPGRRPGTEDSALERNLELLRATDVDDWLPHVTTYADNGTSSTRRLLECDEVALPAGPDEADGTTPGTVAVTGFDATDPLGDLAGADSVGIAVGTGLVYTSADRLYLAASGAPTGCCWMLDAVDSWRGGPLVGSRPALPEVDGTSELHEFVLDGTTAAYTASGEVDGAIRDRWSMDEHDGVLRVAVGPTSETGNFSSIVTLRHEAGADGRGRLVEVGRVDRIGPGEDIEAVRWFGELALVVTFRRVDPLYTVDLADPTDPRVVGELKIPGYSAYLHPLGPHRLLGLGEGPVSRRGWGAQVGLFDLADLGEPRRLDVLSYRPGTRHVAATDPRAFTWLPGSRTALSVITRGWGARTGWVSVVRLDDGVMSQELLEVEHGSDVERVRLVRLADTRVLLVTGDDASFLEL